MTTNINVREIVRNIVNGTFAKHNCLVCLAQLREPCGDIFTKISDDKYSSVADMLELCGIKLPLSVYNKVCSKCFKLASATYLFHKIAQQSEGLLSFYLNELDKQITPDISDEMQSFCITLPQYTPFTHTCNEDLHLDSILEQSLKKDEDTEASSNVKFEPFDDDPDNIVIIKHDNGKSDFFKAQNGKLKLLDINFCGQNGVVDDKSKIKIRKKRKPMSYKSCSQCPVKYRLLGKLKEHMKTQHNIDLHICKVCKAFIEDEQEYRKHLRTHGDIHVCAKCNMVFKKRKAIINHLKWHDDVNNLTKSDKAHICEICGLVLEDSEHLQEHYDQKHVKKYTCYYCGRMYKGEISFEMHIKKHEMHMNKNEIQEKPKKASKRKHTCTQCNKDFVDERSLLWHNRLHTNERPYPCKVCGRAFVSLNRRNQHAVCAHSAPARRCPLCPALFHLRSMVNTHIKKVHLNAHKRRNRTSKHQNVYWKTETVPIQELSVAIQDEILELQAKKRSKSGFDL
ncbi:zinc finger protein 672-like [Colias croceus]|uniref:zinc finger protein 672-like n=1 Tax=Colias crocea TaxID=72248 RepID=UPI001E27F246|nr:zinc finger protein 672-like [Colias croceus]XP_045507793.1 zinc finger protein 672-like [Colias croceus]